MLGVKEKAERIAQNVKKALLTELFELLLAKQKGRDVLFRKVEAKVRDLILSNEESGIPYSREVKYKYMISLLKKAINKIEKGYFSKNYIRRLLQVIVKEYFFEERCEDAIVLFEEKYGFPPPNFCTISPTQLCNLKCTGCYAASNNWTASSLPYWIVERIIKEMHDIAGARFIVFSGGEPFLWKDGKRGMLDMAEEFSDIFFLTYTNSLAIKRNDAERMGRLANITPAISVEGFEEETDRRRGKGVFSQILKKIEMLKDAGVAFGVSVTASKENIDLLLKEEFYRYWFDEVDIDYMWMFHLMPIGRARENIPLMISPEERKELFFLVERLLFEKDYFIGDFWNAGAASDGCIAYGRSGGYFYVNWDGNIMPCVFVPYYKDNIYRLYEGGKTVIDALMSDYFKRGRKWQEKYGFNKKHPHNRIAPCSIRDHYRYFREHILTSKLKPEDEHARLSLNDTDYLKAMDNFDHKFWKITNPLWEERMKKPYAILSK